MKKTVNLFVVFAVIIVLGIAAAVILIVVNSRGKAEKTETSAEMPEMMHYDLLRQTTADGIREYVKNNGLILDSSEDGTAMYIGEVPMEGQSIQVYIENDEQGKVRRVEGSYSVKLTEDPAERIAIAIADFCGATSEFFELENDFTYHIYSKDGYDLDVMDIESMDEILENEGSFGVTAVDSDGSYWNASAKVNDKHLEFTFFHTFETELYEMGSEDIILNEPKE